MKQQRQKVRVTQQDIDKGEGGSPYQCPIAIALSRVYPKCTVSVGSCQVELIAKEGLVELGDVIQFSLSKHSKKFVYSFDSGYPVKPFSLLVPVVSPCGKVKERKT